MIRNLCMLSWAIKVNCYRAIILVTFKPYKHKNMLARVKKVLVNKTMH